MIRFKKGKEIIEVDATNHLAIHRLGLRGFTRVN